MGVQVSPQDSVRSTSVLKGYLSPENRWCSWYSASIILI